MRTVLTIAGSDPGGGAGIQADLKTLSAHRVYALTAITALTVQNSLGVSFVSAVDAGLVAAQIDAVVGDFGAAATKIGMLANRAIVDAVADAIGRHRLANVVIDPVIRASSGAALLDAEAVATFIARLLPLADVVTPNMAEAEALTGLPVTRTGEMRLAAARLVELGARAAIVTGGHLDGPAVDVCFDGRSFFELRADRIDSVHTHGTGCTFSSAVAAHLALGAGLATAAEAAKAYVTRAIAQAPRLGHGRGPLQHFPS